ncbi:MAG: phenylalanine--tRNA ligase subunit beta [Planctomycetota bacterium]
MKLSLRWLGRHVDLSGLEPQQILADLTMSTAEIEGLEVFGAGLEPLVIGEVLHVEPHPDADKLRVCRVRTAPGNVVQIVCGAPNVAQGQKVAVIEPGHTLPAAGGKGALKIKAARIRGVESHGMICSARELALGEDHDGILVLDPALEPGARLVDVVPVQDHVLEIDNKSINHRPDLWGHYGFARELAAIYGRELRPVCAPLQLPTAGRQVTVRIDDRDACPRYCGLCIDGVVATASPLELQLLLAAVGQRSIDLPVDLTNFVMLDLGQPMHAFDLAHLGDRPVIVRRAKKGETITTLDGQARRLDPQDLLICAGDEPEALAGVMGGQGTMVAASTTQLFLESANFHATTIRRTSMRLGLRTDASARFEKAQDPANAELAVHHFVRLLQQWCPTARPMGPLSDPAGFRYAPAPIRLRKARLDLKLGVALEPARVRAILESLQFGTADAPDGLDVTAPSFRATKDVAIEDDLIEEIGRMFRYDNIPEQPLQSVVVPPVREDELFLARRLCEVAATDLGASEIYDYTFVPDPVLRQVGALDGHQYLKVRNPVAPEQTRIRRHVLPSLLANVQDNLRREPEVFLFEHGKGYQPEVRDADGLPREVRELALVWSRRSGAHPFAELREAVATLLRRTAHGAELVREWRGSDQPWVHPGAAVAIDRDGSPVGFVAHLHPQAARGLGIPATTAIATIDVRALRAAGWAEPRFEPLPAFPPLPVDIALLVPDAARSADVAAFLQRVGKKLVRSVQLFEVYRGAGVPDGRKSLNFTVTLGAADRTLDDQDESRYIGKVREQAAEIDAELRG